MRQNSSFPSYPERHSRVKVAHTPDNGGRMDYFVRKDSTAGVTCPLTSRPKLMGQASVAYRSIALRDVNHGRVTARRDGNTFWRLPKYTGAAGGAYVTPSQGTVTPLHSKSVTCVIVVMGGPLCHTTLEASAPLYEGGGIRPGHHATKLLPGCASIHYGVTL